MATKTWTAASSIAIWSAAGPALGDFVAPRGLRTTAAAFAGLALLAGAGSAWAQDVAADNVVSPVVVPGAKPRHYDPAKLDHIMPEVAGTQITVTKKTTVTKLDQQPTIIANNQREAFNKSPGFLVTEQNTPGQFNFGYRGLGNPQESEYVLVLQDGVPISSDWIGFPTLYYLPLPQSVSEIQLIRGGSSLLYGPEPAPAVNFVSRRPTPGEPMNGYTEQVGGSHGLYSTYNVVEGTNGAFEYRAEAGYVRQDGQRDNAQSQLGQVNLYLGWRPDDSQVWGLDLKAYRASVGDPGRITYPQYLADPGATFTPYNHDWVDRYSATLSHTHEFGGGLRLEAKAWMSYLDLTNRTATALATQASPPPATTTLQQDIFQNEGLDVRIRQRWGQGNAFTAGFVAYHSNGPFRQWIDSDIFADRFDHSGTPRLDENRSTNYGALFAENVFRFGSFHVVPSARLDWEQVKVDELVKPAPAPGAPPPFFIDTNSKRTIPLFALGFGNDFGHNNETYFNISQGWRPLRYFDVASPFSRMEPGHEGDPSKSVSYEAGVHGTPVPGLFYDVGVFWINFTNRIETQRNFDPLDPTAVISVNTGDTRHRGFEGELSYDFLARNPSGAHLLAFGSLALLDAKFTDSLIVGQIEKIPAFAPKTILKGGINWRKDKAYDLSLTGTYVSSQFWQDSDLPGPGVPALPAKIPSFTVFDFAADVYVTHHVKLLAGVSNIFDKQYYNRVFSSGIEPAPGRNIYAGISLGF